MFVYRFMAGFVETILGGEEEPDYDPHVHRKVKNPTTYGETMMHLLKGCFGAGLLAMPDAVGRLGVVYGAVSVMLLGVFATYCIQILILGQYKLCKKLRKGYIPFPQTMKLAIDMGPPCLRWSGSIFAFTVDGMLILWQIGVCALYVVFFGESANQMLDFYGYDVSVRLIIAYQFPVLLVINMIRNLKLLTPFSTVSNVLMLIGILLVFFYLVQDDVEITDDKFQLKGLEHIPIFVGITLFAMEAVGVVLALEYNMEKPQQFTGLFGLFTIGMVILTSTFTVLGIFGYMKYGSEIQGIITLNLPIQEKKAQISKMAFAVALFLSFPLQNVVAYQIIWRKLEPKYENNTTKKCLVDYSVRTMLTLVPFAMAAGAPSLGAFMGLLGALCLTLLAIVFPAIIDWSLYYPNEYGPLRYRLWVDIFIVFFGMFCMFSGVYASVREIYEKFE